MNEPVIIAINVIGTNGKLLNPSGPSSVGGAPFLFYCSDPDEVNPDVVTQSEKFRKFIDENVLTVENYSSSRVSFCWYVDGEYRSKSIEVEKWIPLTDAGDLDNRFLKSICLMLLYRAEIEDEITDGDVIEDTYSLVSSKYPGRFSRLTMFNYIREELKKIDLTEENYSHMIELINVLKKDERDSQ